MLAHVSIYLTIYVTFVTPMSSKMVPQRRNKKKKNNNKNKNK